MLHKALIGNTMPTAGPPMVFATSVTEKAIVGVTALTCLQDMGPSQLG